MKISKSNQFILDPCLAYFGASVLKVTCIPFITHFSLRTITFSALASSVGTLIGRRAIIHFSDINFDDPPVTQRDYLVQTAVIVASGTAALLMTQSHPFIHLFPKFMRLSVKDCMILGITQALCIATQLLLHCLTFLDDPIYEEIKGFD